MVEIRDGVAHEETEELLESTSISRRKSAKHLTAYGVLLIFTTSIGGFLFGYDTGVISGALLYLREDPILEGHHDKPAVEGLIVSGTTFGAAFGASVGGWLSDKIGRKRSVLVADAFFILGCLQLALASSVFHLLCGRVVVGLAVGMASTIVPVYIAEVSPKDLRAALVSVNVLMITSGQFFSYLVNYWLSFLGEDCWRYMLGVAGLPAVIQALGLLFLPESPRWLALRQMTDEARSAIAKITGSDHDQVADHMRDVTADVKSSARSSSSPEAKAFAAKLFRYQLYIGVTLQMLQQLSGINTIMYFTPMILSTAGYVGREALLVAMLPALTNALATLLGIWAIERVGRRRLLLSSLIFVSVSLGIIGALFGAASRHTPPVRATSLPLAAAAATSQSNATCTAVPFPSNCDQCVRHACIFCGLERYGSSFGTPGTCLATTEAGVSECTGAGGGGAAGFVYEYGCPSPFTPWIVGFLMVYLIGFASGLSPVPWAVNSEIYVAEYRGLGMGIAGVANWASNSLITLTFLPLQTALPPGGVFYLCMGVAMCGTAWASWALPETKGLTFDEIQTRFAKIIKPSARLQ